jgi:hypothetical protein
VDNRVVELQQRLFGELHDFHVERNGMIIDVLREKLGDEVLKIIEEKGTDLYGLYRWHLEMLVDIIETLTKKYGIQVMDIISEKQLQIKYENGVKLAEESGKNSLEDMIPFFNGGNDERIIEKDDKHVLIKSTGCLPGKIAHDRNKKDIIYKLHCGTDPTFTKGFNDKLGCEVVQTLMDGHDCCIHRIYVKEDDTE